jgi:uncharacterized DUF497 family protein
LRIDEIVWKQVFVDKIAAKHGVDTDEIESVFESNPRFRFASKGSVRGEDVYAAYGRTDAGRYLVVFFIKKKSNALPISAREMSEAERRNYAKHENDRSSS